MRLIDGDALAENIRGLLYDPDSTQYVLSSDVLAAIRNAPTIAEEPRLLTQEEAKKAEVCWLEQRGYEPYVTDDADTWNPEIYGKAYRCWSAKPTDEQRKAEKWE